MGVALYVMALFYVVAGVMHFVNPKFYIDIIPPFLPFKSLINIVSGIVEIVLGTMLYVPSMRRQAAWGVIALLLAVYPANIYHFLRDRSIGTLIRLPLQFLLIWWAHAYTK